MPTSVNPINAVLDYHARTKHHLHRFAASSGYLDWDTQPNPFRTFEGAERIELPLSATRLASARYSDLYYPGRVAAVPLNSDSIGALLELALGLSAWKEYEQTRWALRCNPSSGNLHPTEGYLVVPTIPGLDAGVYHYVSRDHSLERRCVVEGRNLEPLPAGAILLGLSSIHWREAWKYGERAFRYCQHDIGHAIAAVRYAAAALGWTARIIDASDSAVADILGLSRKESFSDVAEPDHEHPGPLLLVSPDAFAPVHLEGLRNLLSAGTWTGRANALSPDHVPWPVIDVVAEAARRTESTPLNDGPLEFAALPAESLESSRFSAVEIIRQRRSAVALDDSTSIPAKTFYGMLARLLPQNSVPPWDVLSWPPYLHCGIFVHRVEGLVPGLYLLIRNMDRHEKLKEALSPDFLFEKPVGCPEHLPFFKLVAGDFRQQAQVISCRQKIAGAGAFSLGMIADFEGSLRERGAWWYRRLFWEAGVLGHVLYLEAEAAGIRGTGIGCYFDDAFHSLLGLRDNQFQSLYHFTAGGPVEDTRLRTLPAYERLLQGQGR
jgi:SagB-type dehydrogenase family enzyme